jgi:hypothetical protein
MYEFIQYIYMYIHMYAYIYIYIYIYIYTYTYTFNASAPQNGIRAVLTDENTIILIRETLQSLDIDIALIPEQDNTTEVAEFEERYNREWEVNAELEDNFEYTRFYNNGDRLEDMDNRIDDEDWGYRSD